MNKYFLFFISVLFSLGVVSCKKEKPNYSKGFVKYFGGIEVERASDVRPTTDGGYIIVGTTSSYGKGGSDLYALKTDANGNEQWSKTFGDTLDDAGSSVQQTSDGGYVLFGTYRYVKPGLDSNKTDMYLVRTNSKGDTLWTKKYGLSGTNEKGISIAQTFDGGYILAGNTDSQNDGDMIFYKVNAAGVLEQPKATYPSTFPSSTGLDEAVNIVQKPDGGYILSSYSFGLNSPRAVFLNSILSSPAPNAPKSDDFFEASIQSGSAGEITLTNDGNYIMTGKTGSGDVFVLKFRNTVSNPKLWFKTYGGSAVDEGSSIQATPDGGYIILGSTNSFGAGSKDIYLLKINANGDVKWTKTFGGAGSDEGRVVRLTSDGGYVILGTLEFGDDPSDKDNIIALIKVDSEGLIEN